MTSNKQKLSALKDLPSDKFPQHIFIIPDGNRRYAKKMGKSKYWGHTQGFKTALKLLRFLRKTPVKTVTLWGFSSDNWKRDKKEISGLMRIFGFLVDRYFDELMEGNSRFIHLGRKDRIPKSLLKKFTEAEEKSKRNTGQIVGLAIDFSGEDQNIRMLEKARKLAKNKEIDEETLWELRDSEGLIRSADLIFRTSETRTSDVGWINGKHTVLYFLPNKFFPEATEKDIADAIYFYANVKRNEGA
ncbi:MAG: polyprenyl diphosphate synthase [Patescibacteria group bacterium]